VQQRATDARDVSLSLVGVGGAVAAGPPLSLLSSRLILSPRQTPTLRTKKTTLNNNNNNNNRMALCVQCYLLMDRVDRAEAQAKAMSAADDDATASQLAAAWVGAELGGAKVQEACYIYQELGDKYMWTVRWLSKVLRQAEAILVVASSCLAAAQRTLTPTPDQKKNTTTKYNTNSPPSTTASPCAA
jgi:hypothetical protein